MRSGTVLTSTQVGIDTHVSGGSRQGLSLSVGYVLLCLWVPVLLGHSEIDDMDDVGAFRARTPDQEIVWLDISVYKVLFVNGLDSRELFKGEP
jgi:hypothetical protein